MRKLQPFFESGNLKITRLLLFLYFRRFAIDLNMAQKKFAVIGAGQFGQAISLALSEKGFEVLVIDKDMKKVQHISDDVAYAICTDATDKRALLN